MWYSQTKEELLASLQTTPNGLTAKEAAKRLEAHGRNELTHKKKRALPLRFLACFADKMTLILLLAAAVSFAMDLQSGQVSIDPFVILAIVFLNAFVSVLQESRAEKALDALRKIASPTCKLLRDGKEQTVSSAEVVPGDLLLLEKGQLVPCDGRLLEAFSLVTDESALTGESGGIRKDASLSFSEGSQLGDIANAVWAGTAVLSGRGTCVAVCTGMETALGGIAKLLEEKPEKTPLQLRLDKLSALFGNLTVLICVGIFLLSLGKGLQPREMFLTSVSLAVAAIPEGLPAIVTIVLSLGVQRMAKQKAIVRRLPAVETLGCAGVICSDKTGTLTSNRMRVTDHYGKTDEIAMACLLCNDRSSPTEEALYAFAAERGYSAESAAAFPRLREIPFDSGKKLMVTLHRDGNGYRCYLKGAPDMIAPYCGGLPSDAARELKRMAGEAKRVIGFAVASSAHIPADLLNIRYTFSGLCGLEDPPREGVAEAVSECRKAGILPVMITGDHADTAAAVARRIGILQEGNTVCTEAQLQDLSQEQLALRVKSCTVFARTTPGFKMRVVDAFRQNGYVVAMTGDGVNDAPALKKADIGCAMGSCGTEVAKEASDVILTDDNFSTIVSAVREGRTIYANIKRAIHFLISCNIGEIASVLLGILLALPAPLEAIQLLWVNLVTDSLPAISLGLEKPQRDSMRHPPVGREEKLFSGLQWLEIAVQGILIGCLSVIAFGIGTLLAGSEVGRTMCFCVLSLCQLFHAFNMRSARSVFTLSPVSNPYLLGSFLLGLGLQVALVSIPFFASLFKVVPLSLAQWGITIGLSAFPILFCEGYKALRRT